MANLTRAATVALAMSQIGTSEYPPGSNRQKYGVWYGFNGVPWCAIFMSWVLAHAGNTSGYRFASTAVSVSWARQRGRLVPLSYARPGDVLVKLYSGTSGHTGMATAAPAGGRLRTVEGNTSDANDRDGGSVMHRDRSLDYWHYCIRLDYPAGADAPSPPPEEDQDLTPQQAEQLQAIADEVGKLATVIRDPVDSIMTDVNALTTEVGKLAVIIRDPNTGLAKQVADLVAKVDAIAAEVGA